MKLPEGKTISMPKKLLTKWLKALRSGKFKQTRQGVMYDTDSCGFCCLGVLQHAASGGSVEADAHGNFQTFPSLEWLGDNKVKFIGSEGYETANPFLTSLGVAASFANDKAEMKLGFKKIANAIEKCAVGV